MRGCFSLRGRGIGSLSASNLLREITLYARNIPPHFQFLFLAGLAIKLLHFAFMHVHIRSICDDDTA